VDLVADILPVLVGLYLLDGAARVRRGQVLLVSNGWGRFVARGPGFYLPGIWPTAEALLTATLPLRATVSGVRVWSRTGSEKSVDFADMEPARVDGGAVRLGRGARLEVAPPGLAAEVAEAVERLRQTSSRRRPAVLRRELRRRCAVGELRSRREVASRDLVVLKVLSSAFFLALFVVLPASLLPNLPVRPSPLAASVLAALLYGAVLVASVQLLRRWGLAPRQVASRLLPLLLFPPAAAHAASQVCRELLLGFEPAAVLAALLDEESFSATARRRRAERLLLAPAPGAEDDGAWNLDDLAWDLVLEQSGHTDARLLLPPPREDASAGAYCPICRAEYRPGFARCSDCGVPLRAFPS